MSSVWICLIGFITVFGMFGVYIGEKYKKQKRWNVANSYEYIKKI